MTDLTTSVVVCAYTEQRWPQLHALFAALDGQQRPAQQVVLVVDHAPALAHRARAAFPRVEVVESTGPRGLSGARNTGVAASRGDVVVFIDDDACPRPDFLHRLLSTYDEDVVAVGGRAVPAWEADRPAWFAPELDWVVGCSHHGLPLGRAEVRNMVGAAMSFRREALLAVGGFDPSLGRTATGAAGCEETELCLRLAAQRPETRIVYEPAAVVDHLVPVTRARLSYLVRRCWGEGRSKARVAGLAGAAKATSAERDYVRRVLPAALLRSAAGSLRLRAGSAAGGLVVLVALVTTTFGYLTGRVRT